MKRLHRSLKDKKLAGICGGVGETYGLDPTLIRLGMVFMGIATGILPLLFTYIVGIIIIPKAADVQAPS